MSYDPSRRKVYRKKVCAFCQNKELSLDYKNVDVLKRLTSESGKIEPRRLTGTCSKHQRQVTREIKKSRNMALMPFVTE